MTRETRVMAGRPIEARADSDMPVLVGYAAVFDQATDIGGMFSEQIKRGAFAEALQRDDIHAVINHNYDRVIGRARAGTLRLAEDDYGLRVEITPPATQEARDLIENIRAGNIDEMSFQFDMQGGRQVWDETGAIPLRTIEQVGTLWEVSIVPRGAYPTTEIGLRSLDEHRKDTRRENYSAASRRLQMKVALDLRARHV